MSAPTVLDRVVSIAASVVEIRAADIRRDDRLEDLGFDALDWINLGLALEHEFRIELAIGELDELEHQGGTIGLVAQAVERKLRARGAA